MLRNHRIQVFQGIITFLYDYPGPGEAKTEFHDFSRFPSSMWTMLRSGTHSQEKSNTPRLHSINKVIHNYTAVRSPTQPIKHTIPDYTVFVGGWCWWQRLLVTWYTARQPSLHSHNRWWLWTCGTKKSSFTQPVCFYKILENTSKLEIKIKA